MEILIDAFCHFPRIVQMLVVLFFQFFVMLQLVLTLHSLGRSKVCLFAFILVLDFLPLIPEHFLLCPKLTTGKHELHWLI